MADPLPFNDYAKGFPADLPQEAYDQARRKYFDQVIAPRLCSADSPIAAWNHFKQGTERPSTLTGIASKAFPVAQFVAGFTHALTKPLATVTKSEGLKRASDLSASAEKSLAKTAMREGRSTVPMGLGEIGGSIAPIAAAELTAGASLELGGVEAGTTAYRLLKGGMAFGAFEAASADQGNRL